MFLSKYGVARHIYIPVVKRAVVDFAVGADWTPAGGDVKISKDGGAAANVTNLPAAIVMGNGAIWDFSMTATEMQAAQVVVTIVDSATKAIEDQSFIIETYGNASGQHGFDLATATQKVDVDTIKTNPVVNGGTVTFPTTATLASTTNITAGTITTVTNLTNAPTAGDLTATMKASVTTAATAATPTAAAVTGAVGSVTARVTANTDQLNGDATAAANIAKTTAVIGRGTASGVPTTTSIPTSAMSPAGAVADQFKGRIITFDANTTTTALRGQATDITASSNSATPTFTVTALTTAPASGDTFSIT